MTGVGSRIFLYQVLLCSRSYWCTHLLPASVQTAIAAFNRAMRVCQRLVQISADVELHAPSSLEWPASTPLVSTSRDSPARRPVAQAAHGRGHQRSITGRVLRSRRRTSPSALQPGGQRRARRGRSGGRTSVRARLTAAPDARKPTHTPTDGRGDVRWPAGGRVWRCLARGRGRCTWNGPRCKEAPAATAHRGQAFEPHAVPGRAPRQAAGLRARPLNPLCAGRRPWQGVRRASDDAPGAAARRHVCTWAVSSSGWLPRPR